MKSKYDIDNLIKRFGIYLEYSLAEEKKRDDEYREVYGIDPPKYAPDSDFNLTKALISMCEEIKRLRDFISDNIVR